MLRRWIISTMATPMTLVLSFSTISFPGELQTGMIFL